MFIANTTGYQFEGLNNMLPSVLIDDRGGGAGVVELTYLLSRLQINISKGCVLLAINCL